MTKIASRYNAKAVRWFSTSALILIALGDPLRLSLIAAAALCVSTLPALANTIVLDSASNSVYSYGLVTTTSSGGQDFPTNSSVVFSGLSGVTAAGSKGDLFSVTFTPTEVTFTAYTFLGVQIIGVGESKNLFTITSPSGALGLASYAATGASPSLSGAVQGPVGTTPEPSSFALLGTGLLGALGVGRKRFA